MLKLFFSLLSGGCLLVSAAAPPSIGIVKSTGEYRVNGSTVPGNSTLFEGDVVETSAARSVVQLGATQLTLLPASRAHIFRDRTVLEKGSGLLAGAQTHAVEAATLRIVQSTKNSVVQVEISAPNRVSVAAREGGAEVRNSSGMLVASLRTGMALAFEPQAGASTAVKMTGDVTTQDGKFYLTDGCAKVKVELLGQDLGQFVGKRVDVAGSGIPGATASGGALQVVQTITITRVKVAPCAAGAPGAGSAGAAGAGPAGLSHAATAAIIGGVAVAGTVVGLATAGTFSSVSPASAQ